MAPAVWAPARWSLCSRATSSILVVDSLLKLTCKINQIGSISCLHENLRHRLRQIYSTVGVTFVPVAPLLLTVVGDFNGLVSVRMKPPFKMYYFFQRKPVPPSCHDTGALRPKKLKKCHTHCNSQTQATSLETKSKVKLVLDFNSN